MEESFANAHLAYANMMAGEADLKAQIEEMKGHDEEVKAENATLKAKTPYAEVPLLNRNAGEELNTTVACFDSLTIPVIEDLPKLVNEPLSKIKDALFYASDESLKE
ncbi:hypothetical protein Hanom_Chr13g01223261 [Helianthus anomalus]